MPLLFSVMRAVAVAAAPCRRLRPPLQTSQLCKRQSENLLAVCASPRLLLRGHMITLPKRALLFLVLMLMLVLGSCACLATTEIAVHSHSSCKRLQ